MTLSIPLFTQDQSYPAWMLRRQQASIASSGVFKQGDFAVSVAGGLQVSAAAGSANVPQTYQTGEPAVADEGVYFVYNDAAANPYNTISAPITNPRVDTVILRVYDIVEQGLSGSSFARLEWLQGSETAGANVTPGSGGYLAGIGTLPANSLMLAYVLQTVGEASISPANILNVAAIASSGVGVVRVRGSSIIPASEPRTNTVYGTMPTPDQVTGIVLPADGLIAVWYQATWQASASAASAAIFIGANQLKKAAPAASVLVYDFASLTNTNATPLWTTSAGLSSAPQSPAYGGDTTTGQLMGEYSSGGPTYIFAAAGTYTISIQFQSSSGVVTVSNRRLYVSVLPFS